MHSLKITFSDDLIFFLRNKPYGKTLSYPLNAKASIKHIIESLGVPHTEIGVIIVNGREVDFNCILNKDEIVGIYGILKPFDVTTPSLLRPYPLRSVRFIADANVGKLAKFLRMSGIDTVYDTTLSDNAIAEIAENDGRVVLSKDVGLLKHKKITHGRYIKSICAEDQFFEIMDFFKIDNEIQPFSLCLQCNKELISVQKKDILFLLEPKTRMYYNSFKMCPQCNKLYWRGSHHENMKKKMMAWGMA